jgi:hypothetical protein
MKKYLIQCILILYFIAGIITICIFNGTGDAGDSILHYLFSKFAFRHPALFFDHWSKPLFVLVSAPFAQFGFNGMKFFNLLVSLLTVYFTYKAANALTMDHSVLAALMVIVAPLNFILTFSGLTEPLFALSIIAALFFNLRQKQVLAAIIISFTPFLRSEGLIMMGVFGLFYILKKDWKPLLFLATGHIVYSIAGYFVYHDILWVFNKIPYASLSSPYGSGNLLHFFNQQYYVIGLPLTFLFWIGFLVKILELVFMRKNFLKEETFLVFFGFISFFMFHTLAWKFGMFNSMGLKRVLIGMIPYIALISLKGFNFLTEIPFLSGKLKTGIQLILVIYLLAFPLLPNPASINWKKDMMLSADQLAAKRIACTLYSSQHEKQKYFFTHPYLSEVLNIDHFDPSIRMDLSSENLRSMQKGDYLIWENWFAVIESGMNREYLEKTYRLIKVKEFRQNDANRESVFVVYIAD